MKPNIHPTFHPDAIVTCSCGNKIKAGGTRTDLFVEICSACHPFYTGTQKLVDTAGRVDKFRAKLEKAKTVKEGKESQKKASEEAKKKSTEERDNLPKAKKKKAKEE